VSSRAQRHIKYKLTSMHTTIKCIKRESQTRLTSLCSFPPCPYLTQLDKLEVQRIWFD